MFYRQVIISGTDGRCRYPDTLKLFWAIIFSLDPTKDIIKSNPVVVLKSIINVWTFCMFAQWHMGHKKQSVPVKKLHPKGGNRVQLTTVFWALSDNSDI